MTSDIQILVVGDANIDLVLQGDVVPRFGQAEQLLDRADLVLGGSAAIVANGLALLGVETALSAVIGEDTFGAIVRNALARGGVRPEGLITVPDSPTGVSVILSHARDRSILTLTGSITLLRARDVRRSVESLRPRHVHFASYFLQPELAAELPELLGWLRERAISTSLDTNWDPAGEWRGIADVIARVDLLFPNREELIGIAARLGLEFSDDTTAARELARLGPKVIVKAGAEGGWSVTPDGVYERADAVEIDVVDTTGAGDSFDAAYLAARVYDVVGEAERLRWAAVAGSLSTLQRGGTASQPTLEQLRSAVDP
jgi:ribokinase